MPGEAPLKVAVYDPPREGLPWIVAFIYPNGQVAGAAAQSAEAAQRMAEGLPENFMDDASFR